MFFSPSLGVLSRSHPRGDFSSPHSSNAHSARKARKKPSHHFSKRLPRCARACAISRISTAAIRASAARTSFRSFGVAHPSATTNYPPIGALQVGSNVLLSSAHEKTRHSPRGRVSRRGGVECCRHATASPHRQFSTERACCSNRARSRSCAHRASACCRERVRGTCGGRTHRASQRRPYG